MNMTAFPDFPVSSTRMFGPAVDGFAECFTATQKLSQAMCPLLPKRYSTAGVSSCQKAPSPTQPQSKHQGPCPKVTLDPELQC